MIRAALVLLVAACCCASRPFGAAMLVAGCAATAVNVIRTERDLADMLAMARDTAATNGGGATLARATGASVATREASSAAPDSLWLRWHAPTVLADGTPARDPQTNVALHLKPQAPAWRPGCERVPACWDSVRQQTTPDTLARLLRVWPGQACAWRIAAADSDSVAAVAENSEGASGWSFPR